MDMETYQKNIEEYLEISKGYHNGKWVRGLMMNIIQVEEINELKKQKGDKLDKDKLE